jgi:hypothetical protein
MCVILRAAGLYMDSSSLTNSFPDQNSDAYVYSAFVWRRYLLAQRRYLLAHYVCALRLL